MKLGKLEEVDVRELWKHEQYDFSNWLSEDENIELLNDVLGLSLVDINKEVFVGSYRCDLVAKDESTNTKVIIENQLEASNHDHLGKIITYASGLDADVVVWIVKEARAEHKSAIEWLNNNTTSDISFFLIELHAYRIGDSVAAPKFEVVEQPNDFIKNTKGTNDSGDLNQSQSERYEFWSQLNDLIIERGKPFNVRKATTNHWYNVALGSSECHISISLINKDNNIIVEVYIRDNKQLFDDLLSKKEVIEKELDHELVWDRLESKNASRIKYYIKGLDFNNHDNYNELMNKTIDVTIKMRDVFKKYI